jgi:hypothetical protein
MRGGAKPRRRVASLVRIQRRSMAFPRKGCPCPGMGVNGLAEGQAILSGMEAERLPRKGRILGGGRHPEVTIGGGDAITSLP